MLEAPRRDAGDYFREWMSVLVKRKLEGYVRLTQFAGYRDSLVTREMALQFEKGEIPYVNVDLDEFDETDFYKCKLTSSVNARLQILSQEFILNKHYLTGNQHAEALFMLQMLNEREMKIIEQKDENFLRTFAAHKNADVEKAEMKRSEYSSKYAFCLNNFRSYDLRYLSRCTTKECLDEYHKLQETKNVKTFKAFQLLKQNDQYNC